MENQIKEIEALIPKIMISKGDKYFGEQVVGSVNFVASELFRKGVRVIHDNEIVITKEEYERLKNND
jgi:hypothetical protein